VLRNNNFLCHVNEQLKQIDFHLVHVNIFDDSYRFFVASKDSFALIDGMQIKNVVEISDNFGADEYYSLGLLHLKAVGFFQPGRSQDKAAEKAKKQKRQIKSLTKLLADESVLLEGEDANSLVPPYARFEIPLLLNTEKAEGRLAMDIGLYTSWAARRASQRMFEGKKDAASILVNCWRLRLLERKFEERCFLRILSERSTLESVSFYDLQHFWPLTIASTAFYYFGFESEWRECSAYYPIFEGRFATIGLTYSEQERMQCALIKFLVSSADEIGSLNKLSETAPFKSFYGTWLNDDLFLQAIDSLCDWHLDECHSALRGDSFVHEPGYDFLPMWILAIDRKRERVLGRSCLPKNQLLSVTSRYLETNFPNTKNEIVEKLEFLYSSTYGTSPVDLAFEWNSRWSWGEI
jgi:hypothetical protein